jgi:hypothetical protein
MDTILAILEHEECQEKGAFGLLNMRQNQLLEFASLDEQDECELLSGPSRSNKWVDIENITNQTSFRPIETKVIGYDPNKPFKWSVEYNDGYDPRYEARVMAILRRQLNNEEVGYVRRIIQRLEETRTMNDLYQLTSEVVSHDELQDVLAGKNNFNDTFELLHVLYKGGKIKEDFVGAELRIRRASQTMQNVTALAVPIKMTKDGQIVFAKWKEEAIVLRRKGWLVAV